ncbi:MAG TPA: PspA/IM30 family protein [Longimicrobiaceae bacterium]
MFEDLKSLFSRAYASFHDELSRREPEDQVAELLGAMRREMVEARANLPVLEEGVARARAELERERRALADVERRGGMAERIGDAETARVAAEFTARHRERIAVLEDKVRTAEAERDLHAREISEMSRKYKEADANRFAMVARLRTARAKGNMGAALGGAGGPQDDLDRVAEGIEDRARHAEAMEELSGLDDPAPPPRSPADDVEERLRELKRRMGRE